MTSHYAQSPRTYIRTKHAHEVFLINVFLLERSHLHGLGEKFLCALGLPYILTAKTAKIGSLGDVILHFPYRRPWGEAVPSGGRVRYVCSPSRTLHVCAKVGKVRALLLAH